MKKKTVIVATVSLLAVVVFALSRYSQAHQTSAVENVPFPIHSAAATNPEAIGGLVADGHLVNQLDDNGVTPLLIAVMVQKHAAVVELLSLHADPNIVIEGQDSPLTNAAMWGNLDTVSVLVDHGADVNSQYMSRTALHQAIIYGHNDITQFLLDRPEIDFNQRENGTGYTPLHNAVQHERLDAIMALLKMGADPNAKDGAGNTSRDLAIRKTDTAIAACFEQ